MLLFMGPVKIPFEERAGGVTIRVILVELLSRNMKMGQIFLFADSSHEFRGLGWRPCGIPFPHAHHRGANDSFSQSYAWRPDARR